MSSQNSNNPPLRNWNELSVFVFFKYSLSFSHIKLVLKTLEPVLKYVTQCCGLVIRLILGRTMSIPRP